MIISEFVTVRVSRNPLFRPLWIEYDFGHELHVRFWSAWLRTEDEIRRYGGNGIVSREDAAAYIFSRHWTWGASWTWGIS